MLIALALLACTGGDAQDSVADTTPTEITWPSSNRVLVYQGHGGVSGDSVGNGGWNQVVEELNAAGFEAETRSSMSDASAYRAVFFISPGQQEDVILGDNTVASIQAGLEAGTRMIVLAGEDNCDSRAISTLLSDLGAPMSLTGESSSVPVLAQAQPGNQLAKGIEEGVLLSNPCTIDKGDADAELSVDRDLVAVSWRPGWGGDVVLVGDHRFADDTGRWENRDNLRFVLNLAEVDPEY